MELFYLEQYVKKEENATEVDEGDCREERTAEKNCKQINVCKKMLAE